MTQALLSAVGAPESLGLALTTSIRSSAKPTSSTVEILLGFSPGLAAAPGAVETPVTMATPPELSRQTVSSLLVPFSSFSIDSCKRLVMMVVFTDALICAIRLRYGAALGDLPQGDSLN